MLYHKMKLGFKLKKKKNLSKNNIVIRVMNIRWRFNQHKGLTQATYSFKSRIGFSKGMFKRIIKHT